MPSAVPVSPEEFVLLTRACEQLPVTNVQDEEKHVADNPVLTLMSTVLSLNRRWYSHALPARRYFEANLYNDLKPPTLAKFASLLDRISLNKSDWSSAAKKLWDRNEWDKCRMLSELTEYFVVWKGQNLPDHSDREALKQWGLTTSKEDFLGRIKGLAARAHEQLLWYIEGTQAIKLDRHVVQFVFNEIGRSPSDDDTIAALRTVAKWLGISATELDARIWDVMQSQGAKNTRWACR
jgi:hypothetical protein